MPQLTIYLDKETQRKVRAAARRANATVSSWVKDTLNEALETSWPKNFFSLFGSLADERLERPQQPRYEDDAPRKKL